MNAKTLLTVALCGAAALVASAATHAVAPPEALMRDCSARYESNQPIVDRPTANDVRFGALVLTRYPEWRKPLKAYGANPEPEVWPYVLKAPVRLRAGTTATFAIAPAARNVAAILPSASREWVPAVRFRSCAANKRAHAYTGTVGPLTVFGQVIGLKKPSACVPIEVWLDGRATPIRRVVAIGRTRC
jgi:hypothetical protein